MAFSGLGLENVVGFDVLERYLFTKASVAVLILIPRRDLLHRRRTTASGAQAFWGYPTCGRKNLPF